MAPLLVYRDKLLPPSETFVLRHYDRLERYRPMLVGLRRVAGGLSLAPHPAHLLAESGGASAEALFRLTGRSRIIDSWITRDAPVAIHAHFGKSGARILPTALRHDLPLIVSFHGGDATKETHFRPFWRTASVFALRRKALARHAALFLTDSGYLSERLAARGFPPDRMRVHHIGIDTSAYRPGPEGARRREVVFVGRFVEKKGLPILIEAMRLVQASTPDIALVLIGDGPERAAVEAAARDLPAVQMRGWQSPEAVRAAVAGAMIVAVPSVIARNGDCEGLPSVIYEAAALATPVVATRHSGIPEAVRHGETGLLVPERDAPALAQAILELAHSPEARARFGAAARAHAERDLDSAVRGRALERMLDEAIAAHRSAARPAP